MTNKTLTKITSVLVALVINCAIVGCALAAYTASATPVSVAIFASVSWDHVLTVDLTGVSWFEDSDCRANVFITYTDSSVNAAYPGEAMTRTAAGVYTVQTNAEKTISTVSVIRMNGSGTYMYNKTANIAASSIPANHTLTLLGSDFSELPSAQRTPYYALSVNITWAYFPTAVAKIYIWYTDETNNTWPGVTMEKTETGSNTYTVNWDALIPDGKTVAGFIITRCESASSTSAWNKSQDYTPSDIPASRLITISDMVGA